MKNLLRLSIIITFRLLLWCLMTSSFTVKNIGFGLVISCLIPFGQYKNLQLRSVLPEIVLTLKLPIDMLIESFKVMAIRHPRDKFTTIKISPMAKKNSQLSIFMDIFRITFTPMSMVVGRADDDHWKIHTIVSSNQVGGEQE